MTRAPFCPACARAVEIVLVEPKPQDEVVAQRDALRDALSALVSEFPELRRAFGTPQQQAAWGNAEALVIESKDW